MFYNVSNIFFTPERQNYIYLVSALEGDGY